MCFLPQPLYLKQHNCSTLSRPVWRPDTTVAYLLCQLALCFFRGALVGAPRSCCRSGALAKATAAPEGRQSVGCGVFWLHSVGVVRACIWPAPRRPRLRHSAMIGCCGLGGCCRLGANSRWFMSSWRAHDHLASGRACRDTRNVDSLPVLAVNSRGEAGCNKGAQCRPSSVSLSVSGCAMLPMDSSRGTVGRSAASSAHAAPLSAEGWFLIEAPYRAVSAHAGKPFRDAYVRVAWCHS